MLVRADLLVPRPQALAFALFAERMNEWWPREYTWSQDGLEWIGLEPKVDGHCFEVGPHGFHVDWGRVLVWQPPARLVLLWQISPRREPEPNPDKASEVEVRFEAVGPADTRVSLEHRHFDRHGPGGGAYRAALGADQGWPFILKQYAVKAG
jgi:uncharacterized protein YndB with AHSA1/START domain